MVGVLGGVDGLVVVFGLVGGVDGLGGGCGGGGEVPPNENL